ncbi:MAG: GNAT family N-acetyltransferase [Coleofasciculaceae cyanobacterium]
MTQYEYSDISNPQAAKSLGVILGQCFGDPSPTGWETYAKLVGRENFRLIRQAGNVAGGLAILSVGQWYNFKIVPTAAIASVGIAPEYRGSGTAAALLSNTLKELYTNGVALSVLYAATQRLYRKVGYEQAGNFCRWEIAADSIQISDRTLPIYPINLAEPELLFKFYHENAKATNGHLERNQCLWQLLLEPPKDQEMYAYLIGSEVQPEGYVIFFQYRESNEFKIVIRDWMVLTEVAARRLWTFLADHRSQIEKIQWRSSIIDPLSLLLPEQTAKISVSDRWLLRVVDVAKALSKRGYPPQMKAQLNLDICDDLIEENNGKFILTVSGGRGEVTKGGTGDLQCNIRALAPLYTGLFTALQLQQMGQIKATHEALAIATQLFSGSQPWMSDKF